MLNVVYPSKDGEEQENVALTWCFSMFGELFTNNLKAPVIFTYTCCYQINLEITALTGRYGYKSLLS